MARPDDKLREAIQKLLKIKLDCFVAVAPRNDGAERLTSFEVRARFFAREPRRMMETIAVTRVQLGQRHEKSAVNNSGSLSGCRVFVVEDEALVAMLLQDLLADIGCEVVDTACRFNDAVQKAGSLAFDVAILDVNLNGQRTFPIAETLAESGRPFVFATGYGAASLPPLLQNAPILQKPFQCRDLERALRAALAA